MLIVLLIGLVLVGIATTLLARSMVVGRTRAAQTLAQIGAYGYGIGNLADHEPIGGFRAAVDTIAGRLGRLLTRRDSPAREADLRRELVAAGLYNTSPRTFTGYRALGALGGGLVMLWLGSSAAGPVFAILAALFFAFAGWIAPARVVKIRAQNRMKTIEHDLPELIDLLVVTVEAGLGFSGSLRVASERLSGPLGEELRLTMQEQSMGLSTMEALRNMLARCETPSMRSFVRSVIQGESLGVSIGQIMRNLALEMRKRRRSAAEERAQKAPVKILFPLVFLIFPAMFIVLLGPALFDFIGAFGSR